MKKDKFNKEQLKQIALVCFRSATELFEDAELLFSMHRYARATFLSFIGLEELGKSILAFNLIEYKVEPKRSEFLDFWRDHILKLAHAYGYCGINPEALQKILPDEVPKGHKDWYEFCEKQQIFYQKYSKLNSDLKLMSLYVDIKTSKQKDGMKISLPSTVIKKEHAKRFIKELNDKISEFIPNIRSLGFLKLPPYDTGDIY